MAYFKLPALRVHLFGYVFSPGLIPTIAVLLLLPVLISLGFWQLQRAHVKKILEHDFSHQNQALSLAQVQQLPQENVRYRSLEVVGTLDENHKIYLDNKTYRGQRGVHVLVPFKLKDTDTTLLINQGFKPIANRSELSRVITAHKTSTQSIKGLIFFPSKPFLLKKEEWNGNWPMLVQGVNIKQLASRLHVALLPFVLLETEPKVAGLQQDWHPVGFPSYRHTGYAVQWFALALTLLIIYLKVNTTKLSEKRSMYDQS